MRCKIQCDPKKVQSIERHASDNQNTDLEDKYYPFRAPEMRNSRHPVEPVFQNELDLNETVLINENSNEEDYHMLTS